MARGHGHSSYGTALGPGTITEQRGKGGPGRDATDTGQRGRRVCPHKAPRPATVGSVRRAWEGAPASPPAPHQPRPTWPLVRMVPGAQGWGRRRGGRACTTRDPPCTRPPGCAPSAWSSRSSSPTPGPCPRAWPPSPSLRCRTGGCTWTPRTGGFWESSVVRPDTFSHCPPGPPRRFQMPR